MPPTCRQPRGSRRSRPRKTLALSKSVCLFTPSQGKKRRRQRFGIAMMRGLWYSICRNDAKGHFVNDRNQMWMCKRRADANSLPTQDPRRVWSNVQNVEMRCCCQTMQKAIRAPFGQDFFSDGGVCFGREGRMDGAEPIMRWLGISSNGWQALSSWSSCSLRHCSCIG